MKEKSDGKKTRKKTKKKDEKKKKRAQRGTPPPLPRRAQKLIFYMRTVNRNRNEIETQKKSDFEHPTKKKRKERTNERK